MPFLRPTLGALIQQTQQAIAAQLPGADATLRRSNLGVIARVFAGLTHLVYGYLDWQARQLLPDTAEAEYLDRQARIWGLSRKAALHATGSVTLAGTDGISLEAGAVLTRADGVRFVTLVSATIAAGTASVPVQAEAGGVEANTPAGATLGLVVAVPGIAGSATVAAGGITGGAASDYVQWALTVDGVTRAWVYPRNRGAGTVDVAFVMDGRAEGGGSIIPGPADVAAVQAAIDLRRPVCDDCVVFAPTAVPLNVTIAGLADDTPEVRAAIEVELAAQIQRDAVPGGTIWRSRLIEAVSRATGEQHHSMVAPASDVTAGPGSISVLGTVSFA